MRSRVCNQLNESCRTKASAMLTFARKQYNFYYCCCCCYYVNIERTCESSRLCFEFSHLFHYVIIISRHICYSRYRVHVRGITIRHLCRRGNKTEQSRPVKKLGHSKSCTIFWTFLRSAREYFGFILFFFHSFSSSIERTIWLIITRSVCLLANCDRFD